MASTAVDGVACGEVILTDQGRNHEPPRTTTTTTSVRQARTAPATRHRLYASQFPSRPARRTSCRDTLPHRHLGSDRCPFLLPHRHRRHLHLRPRLPSIPLVDSSARRRVERERLVGMGRGTLTADRLPCWRGRQVCPFPQSRAVRRLVLLPCWTGRERGMLLQAPREIDERRTEQRAPARLSGTARRAVVEPGFKVAPSATLAQTLRIRPSPTTLHRQRLRRLQPRPSPFLRRCCCSRSCLWPLASITRASASTRGRGGRFVGRTWPFPRRQSTRPFPSP
mmetsp:Transcript_5304/g.17072  ORF Transcript_5304/g.17072 Transcript_5304/m.17072 type:complete len:281 (+) Transcript_5304:484-1326(+)